MVHHCTANFSAMASASLVQMGRSMQRHFLRALYLARATYLARLHIGALKTRMHRNRFCLVLDMWFTPRMAQRARYSALFASIVVHHV